MSAFIVRHGMWVMAAALALMLGAGVFGTFTPWTAAALAFAVIVLLVGGLFTAGIVSEHRMREDESERPGGRPAARFSASAGLREPVKTRPVMKAIERNERRHGGA